MNHDRPWEKMINLISEASEKKYDYSGDFLGKEDSAIIAEQIISETLRFACECDHCFCKKANVQSMSDFSKHATYIYIPHMMCCNCGYMKKILSNQ